MGVAATSIYNYRQLDDLNQRHLIVLYGIEALPNCTDYELTKAFGRSDPNFIRPRRNELYKMGMIRQTGVRQCNVTGRLSATWDIKRNEVLDKMVSYKEVFKLDNETDKLTVEDVISGFAMAVIKSEPKPITEHNKQRVSMFVELSGKTKVWKPTYNQCQDLADKYGDEMNNWLGKIVHFKLESFTTSKGDMLQQVVGKVD